VCKRTQQEFNGLYHFPTRQEKLLMAILTELVNIRTFLESSSKLIATEAEWDIYNRLRKEALDAYDQSMY